MIGLKSEDQEQRRRALNAQENAGNRLLAQIVQEVLDVTVADTTVTFTVDGNTMRAGRQQNNMCFYLAVTATANLGAMICERNAVAAVALKASLVALANNRVRMWTTAARQSPDG